VIALEVARSVVPNSGLLSSYPGGPGFLGQRCAMDESRRSAIEFLEKEIKTYMALSLFLSKKGIKEDLRMGEKKVLGNPSFYQARLKEAKKLVHELKKPH
jgi:hypothetical protein